MNAIKKEIIRALSVATTIDLLKNNKLILTTAAGLIYGTPCPEDTEKQGSVILTEILDKIVDNYGVDNINGNDGFLHLTDVTILTGNNNRINIHDLVVFYDQIIGVSLGTI